MGQGFEQHLAFTVGRLGGTADLESFTYLGLGTVVERTRGNGIDLTHIGSPGDAGDQYAGLDRFGRIETMLWTDGSTATDNFEYGYDRSGNRLYERNGLNSVLSERYVAGPGGTYDRLNRLTDFARGTLNSDLSMTEVSREQDWDLDQLGNMPTVTTDGVAESRDTDSQNRLTDVDSNSLAYSPNGEMTTDEEGNTLTYDAWGKMVVWSDGTQTITFTYDALGRRIVRDDGTDETHRYFSSQWQVLEERAGLTTASTTAPTTTQYVWSPVYVDAMVLRDRDTDADGDLTDGLGGGGGSERLYVQHDANFNITVLADAAGQVVERMIYDAYGSTTVLDATWIVLATTAHDWHHGHQGGELDPTTGLHHFRNRDHDAVRMRWTSQDPMGYVDGLTLYLAPAITGVDPFGLQVQWWPAPYGNYDRNGMPRRDGNAERARRRAAEKKWKAAQFLKLSDALRVRCSTNNPCCSYDTCLRQADEIAMEVVNAVAAIKIPGQLSGNWGNLTLYQNQRDHWAAAIVQGIQRARSEMSHRNEDPCFTAFNYVNWKKDSPPFYPTHNWVEIMGNGGPNLPVVLDPWPSGGGEIIDPSVAGNYPIPGDGMEPVLYPRP